MFEFDDIPIFEIAAFIGRLNELAEKTTYGFFKFEDCTDKNRDSLHWDCGIVYNDQFDVLCDGFVDELHHTWISSWSDYMSGLLGDDITVKCVFPDPEDDELPYIIVGRKSSNHEICIDDGRWYPASY